jgi:hypothetical protein
LHATYDNAICHYEQSKLQICYLILAPVQLYIHRDDRQYIEEAIIKLMYLLYYIL